MSKSLLLFICFLSSVLLFKAQTIHDNIDLNQQIENIAEKQENEELDYTDFFQHLAYYKQHPINLNHTDGTELRQLNLLNPIQINRLLHHIHKNGKLLSIYELQSIDGFDYQTFEKILPFVIVADEQQTASWKFKNIIRNSNHLLLIRGQQILEKQKGFLLPDSLNSAYLGSRPKIYSRYRFSYADKISAGITAEKDAGEAFFSPAQKQGFDFYSAHCYISNFKKVKAFAIGDYQVSYGQGLVAWSGLAFDKSSDAMNVNKNATGLRPYMSADENRFMRGVAATVEFKSITLSGFFSNKKIDAAALPIDTFNQLTEVSSMPTSGYHRTRSEIQNKDALGEMSYGGNISYKKRNLSLGLSSFNTFFDKNYKKAPSYYNQFDFSANQLSNLGTDYNWNTRNVNFFGEFAISSNGGLAFINGMMVALDQRLSLAFLHRNYQRNYQALYSNGFAENTKTANEKGMYLGINCKITDQVNLNFYYDRFVFPWLKYQVSSPSHGNDYLAQISYTTSKKTEMYFRFRWHDKMKNENDAGTIDLPVSYSQINYRYHVAYKISPSLKLANRIEIVSIEKADIKESGYMIYQDIRYKGIRSKFSLAAKYVLFSTDSYNSRIYAAESDLSNSFAIPAYYYKGSRFYFVATLDINKNSEVGIRYGQSMYDNKKLISEGSLDEIEGNKKSEVKAQFTVKF